jgi:hypothetical protein
MSVVVVRLSVICRTRRTARPVCGFAQHYSCNKVGNQKALVIGDYPKIKQTNRIVVFVEEKHFTPRKKAERQQKRTWQILGAGKFLVSQFRTYRLQSASVRLILLSRHLAGLFSTVPAFGGGPIRRVQPRILPGLFSSFFPGVPG